MRDATTVAEAAVKAFRNNSRQGPEEATPHLQAWRNAAVTGPNFKLATMMSTPLDYDYDYD